MDISVAVLVATVLAVVAGFLDALNRNVIKVSSAPVYFLNGFGFLFALPVYLTWLSLTGMPHVDPGFWWVFVAITPLLVVAYTLTVTAHRTGPMVKTAPYLGFTPLFLLVTAPLMGTGEVHGMGALGVVVMVAGVYILNVTANDISFTAPFKNLLRERASWLMLAVAAIFSLTSNLDYFGVLYANGPFWLFVCHGTIALCSLILGIIDKHYHPEEYKGGLKKLQIGHMVLFGLFTGCAAVPHMMAFAFTDKVAYVIAGKRAGIIICSVGISVGLSLVKRYKGRFDSERAHLRFALPGVMLIVVGMVLVIFN